MKILRVVCLAGVLLSCAAATTLVHASRAFGYIDNGTAFVVDTGAGLVFQVSKTDGSITSIVFNGTEYRSSTNGRFSQIASGLGTPTTVTAESDGSTYVKITIQTGQTNGVVASLTHYLIVRNGENTIYMATFPTAEPAVGELRWITRLNHELIPNGPVPSELNGTVGAIESTDIFGNADGTTRSKYYGDTLTHGKDRAMDLSFNGATGPGIGAWMVFGTRESSSGGPFFRDIENQAGGDQEIYNYMNSGHNQTEPFRLNVLHGPYALIFTTGDMPALPVDFSWIGSLNLMGWVSTSGRGAVSGTVTGIPAGFQAVVGVANTNAQYWAAAANDGSYVINDIKPGTYTATLYKGEFEVATSPVTVTAGQTSPLNLASTETGPSVIFRIGEWDGTPAGLLNGDKIVQMHPSDVRMSPWDTTNFMVGLDDAATFPAIQFRGQNSPTTITFNLAPNQITDLAFRIGITCAYNGGRPSVQINGQPTVDPPLSNQPNSRSFTIGTYRGNNTLFTYTLAAGALVAGENRLTITPISGSTDLGAFLSAGWVYDAVELDGPIATPVITYVGGNPLVISGTSEPGRNIALTLDGSTAAGSTVATAGGVWTITYNASLSAGSHSFTAVSSDNLGHSSPASPPFTFNTNITTPAIVAAVGDTGTFVSGATTSDRTFAFNGTAGAGDTVKLTRVGTGVIATVVASGSGDWTFDYSGVALGAGTNSFYATSSNAGGTSPSSSIFVLNIQGTPRVAIVRFNPLTETITSGVTSVVFRVAFSSVVSGVTTGAFVLTTSGSATATIASVSASSGTIFDVTLSNLAGTGMMRLDLKPGNGIVDAQGNPEPGYHAGEAYTLVLPTIGNGVWIRPVTGGLWSDPANWLNAVIPDGNIYSADFSTLDLTAGNTVHLDSPRTINSAIFGDSNATTPASWVLDNNGLAANSLTLAGTAHTMTVNALGTGASATMLTSLTGTGGLNKAGAGSLVLGAANMLTGPLTLNGGILQLPQGGSLNIGNNTVDLALNTQLNVAGGSFTTGGLVTAVTSQVVIDSGSATLGSFRTNSDFSGTLRVNGGTLNVGDVNIRRNSAAAADFTSGFIIAGTGVANATTIGLGTANSTGAMSIEGNGSLTATGTITVANQATSGRGGAMRVLNNGTFTSTDTTLGVLMCRTNGANANNVASATFTGGVSTVERFTLGFDSTVTAGSATINVNGGTLYIGSGGILKNGAAGLATNLNFGSGVVGAKADWSTSLPINLPNGGNVNLKSSDAADAAHDIALNGVLSGAGGLTKIGGGRLVLGAANTFTGAVGVNAGTLSVDGSLAAGAMAINSGGTLTGSGTINRSVVLNSGGTLRPGTILNAASLVWSGGGVISYNLGASSNQLALNGALTKGGAGAYNFAFTTGAGFTDGNVYTLVTFGSTDFTADDFTFSGLPDGFSGIFTVTANSVTFTALIPPSIVTQPQNETVLLGGIARFSVVASGSPVLGYQWFRNSILIPGASGSVLTINNVLGANIGSYTVTVTNAVGSVTSNSARLLIAAVSLVNHAPDLNSGRLEGSLQLMSGESLTLNGSTSVIGDLLVPGTPSVVVNGSPSYVGTVDDDGSAAPSNYSVTLNSKVSLEHVIRRTDPVSLPVVNAPVSPTGSSSVTINNPNQSVGDWATVRNLTLNGSTGRIAVPAGAYGDFTANSGTGFTLGVAGASEPAVYYFQHLMLNNQAAVEVVAPVIVIVANGFSVSGGSVGNSADIPWLTLSIYSGGLSLTSGAIVYGYLSMPNGTLTIGGNCQVAGVAAADSLTINKDGRLLMAELN